MIDGESQLVTRAIRGEAEAFGLLYDKYQSRIYRFVLLKVGHREEAEDLTHQVFLHAWQRMEHYTEQGFPFSSWLYRIARNAVIDHYRTKKEHTSIDDLAIEPIAMEVSLPSAMEDKLNLEKVWQVVRELSDEQQDILIMRFVEDMPQKEIAATLGKSEGAVKVMQHRALGRLKQKLLSDETGTPQSAPSEHYEFYN